MAIKKKIPIKYTSRDFDSIKRDLVDYAKRYYADSFRDFSEASFGSLMIDSVAYIGDILSFYLDYQVNESFLDSATEYNNIIRLGEQMGYKFRGAESAFGECAFFIKVPADQASLGPDSDYIPKLQKGTTISSIDGATFILNEDVDFADPANLVGAAEQDTTTGRTSFYAIQAFGQVVSGELGIETLVVGSFEKFKKLKLNARDIVEILSVTDSEGNEYFEVDNLSQNIVYRSVINRETAGRLEPAAIMKPFVVPRRFVVDRSRRETALQFGFGSDSEVNESSVVDPTNIILKKTGRSYISDTSFDPTKLLETDKFGIAPSNTTLTITFRRNSVVSTNAAARTVTNVVRPTLVFKDPSILDASTRGAVESSIEVLNYDPIVGDVSNPSNDELKQIIMGVFAAQNRAVTDQDYKSLVYSMPPQFGGVARCSIYKDSDSFRRNLNLYVISKDNEGYFTTTNATIKNNLKTWLGQNKIISDTIDILDAKVVNIRIRYSAVSATGFDKFEALSNANTRLKEKYQLSMDIGEPFSVSEIYNILNKTRGIADVRDVVIENITGTNYSDIGYNIRQNTTPDGRYVKVPKNVILELKFPDTDIIGSIE